MPDEGARVGAPRRIVERPRAMSEAALSRELSPWMARIYAARGVESTSDLDLGLSALLPPDALTGATNLGFMILPNYRAWVVAASLVVCLATWFVIERTRLGAYLRAGTENPKLTQAFGINVPLMIMLTYGFGVGLAALAGVLAAPLTQVSPLMGSNLIIVVFAVVVIGGMGSILGSIFTGLGLGVIEGLTKVFYPEASSTVVFVIMALVLLVRPAGLFGRER